jgi:glycosyltransferase involved in cell wall biosynthesis
VERLHALAKGKSVRFRHDCTDEMLVDAYRRALCLVLPSLYRTPEGATNVPELLGQTLLEAMACATPVLCTRVASMPEIVEDGATGFVVDADDRAALADRLRWLASHPLEAAAMGEAGRHVVLERFQWNQVVDRCLTAYQSLPS